MKWTCKECEFELSDADWPYTQLANCGGPVCPECDYDLDFEE